MVVNTAARGPGTQEPAQECMYYMSFSSHEIFLTENGLFLCILFMADRVL